MDPADRRDWIRSRPPPKLEQVGLAVIEKPLDLDALRALLATASSEDPWRARPNPG
jgi:hypothetical protein